MHSPVPPSARDAGALLLLAQRDEARLVLVGIPRSLRPVGADEVEELAPGGGPLGERGAGAELDVVGMGADGEGARRRRKVGGDVHVRWR